MGNLSKDIFAGSGFAPSNIILSKNGGKDFYSKIFEKYTLNNTPLNITLLKCAFEKYKRI